MPSTVVRCSVPIVRLRRARLVQDRRPLERRGLHRAEDLRPRLLRPPRDHLPRLRAAPGGLRPRAEREHRGDRHLPLRAGQARPPAPAALGARRELPLLIATRSRPTMIRTHRPGRSWRSPRSAESEAGPLAQIRVAGGQARPGADAGPGRDLRGSARARRPGPPSRPGPWPLRIDREPPAVAQIDRRRRRGRRPGRITLILPDEIAAGAEATYRIDLDSAGRGEVRLVPRRGDPGGPGAEAGRPAGLPLQRGPGLEPELRADPGPRRLHPPGLFAVRGPHHRRLLAVAPPPPRLLPGLREDQGGGLTPDFWNIHLGTGKIHADGLGGRSSAR